MRAIGIRELRQQASRYLREVQAGETVDAVGPVYPDSSALVKLVVREPESAAPG